MMFMVLTDRKFLLLHQRVISAFPWLKLMSMNKRDLMVPYGVIITNVSEDIRFDKGDHVRFKSDVLLFNKVLSKSILF